MKGRSVRNRKRIPTVASFSVTSMMDMFTIILVFLLNFLDPAQAPAEVELPAGVSEQTVGKGVVLTVTPDKVMVEGQEVMQLQAGAVPPGVARTGRRLDALYQRLSAAASSQSAQGQAGEQGAANAALVVECDRGVPFSVLGELLYTAGQAGFGQFRFVVISDPG